MNYFDYMPLAQNRAGQLGALDGTAYAQWATSADFVDYWGTPKWDGPLSPEVYGVAECGGEQWLTLARLGPHAIKTLKAVVTRDGVAKEIECATGHPYALLNFVPHRLKVWGDVGGMLFYWEVAYSLAIMRNPLLGDRECIVQRECWGNPKGGGPSDGPWEWVRGGPIPPTAIPFAKGKPVDIACEFAWFQGIGKGYGPTWVMGETKDDVDTVTSCANSGGWSW